MAKQHSTSTFQEFWLSDPKYELWIAAVESCKSKVRCKLCRKDFDVANNGVKALDSHQKGKKHQELEAARKPDTIRTFFQSKSSADSPSSSQLSSTDTSSQSSRDSQSTLTSFVLDENTLNAEIRWCLFLVKHHFSYRSCDPLKNMLQSMCPDSAIPAKFSLSRTKARYMIIYGLFPEFKKKLKSVINSSPWFTISFDESHNKDQQMCQMDINIRYWNGIRAESSYFDSQFLYRPNALNLTNSLLASIDGLELCKFLHLAMDGPNTNWNVLNEVDEHLVGKGQNKTMHIGSCSLHIVHGAFETGTVKTGWELSKVLKAMYKIFDESPARRDVYLREGSSSEFPLKFCNTRWIEDDVVAQRALKVWDSVVLTVKYWGGLCVSKRPKNNKSYDSLVKHHLDLLIPAKLHFFVFIAGILKPYLVLFQTDAPMLPFMYDELSQILTRLLGLIYRKEKLDEAKTLPKIMKVDWLNKKENQLDDCLIDVGAAAKNSLTKAKVAAEKKRQFRKECNVFVLNTLLKLQERLPTKYSVVRNASSINPLNMVNDGTAMSKRFVQLANDLFSLKFVSSHVADNAKFQYDNLLKKTVVQNQEKFSEFDMRKDRVDEFLHSYVGTTNEYKELWEVFKLIFVLSHGQSSIERGFSINKCITDVNMKDESLVSQRLVYDVLQKSEKEVWEFPITPELRKSCKLAYSRKLQDDERKKVEKEKSEKNLKRQQKREELEVVKQKKRNLEDSIKTLRDSLVAEAIASDGTSNNDHQEHITKAASFAKTLVEKEKTLKDLAGIVGKLEDEYKTF